MTIYDVPCRICKGNGFVLIDAYEEAVCGECEGTGWELTEEGRAMLAFLDRHETKQR